MNRWLGEEGAPCPLGVTYREADRAYDFALYAKHATGVTLLLYGETDAVTPLFIHRFDPLKNKSGRVWHCRLPADPVEAAVYYGYRVEGPFQPEAGHRFDPQKVLLDPYARAVHFPPGFSREAACQAGDNAGRAPLGVLHAGRRPFDWSGDRRPTRHTHDTVIYEMHVRGFTRGEGAGVAAERAGTFAGVIDKVPYLKELGVTVVELLPVFQFDPQEGNYWGYMPLGFFAPHHAYAGRKDPGGQLDAFREMVVALHRADIEVVLDVVYNHTTEGNEAGPTYSFRGIDNTTYYLLADDWRHYHNDAGTGNVLHTANRQTRAMVLDSLRYWVREMRVDGFRFDLASIFTRRSDGTVNLDDPPIISAIRSDPDLAGARLIAEAWDPASYQLGRSFPGITWLQWNGRFRDDVRGFVKSDGGLVEALMQRLYGSDDLFPGDVMNAYHPYQSVNLVTAHDGLNLCDLVSYGGGDNRSWNCGWEGEDGAPPEVLALRRRQVRNFCALLMLANGTPMLVAGDEFMHTQGGNNNPWNQDNETTWLDWRRRDAHPDVFRFFARMIAFRKAHPSLGRSRFWRDDVRWLGVNGPVDRGSTSHALAFHLDGASQGDGNLYVMINAFWEPLQFTVQAPGPWRRAVDTGRAAPDDIAEPGDEVPVDATCTVGPRSVVVLVSG